MFARRLPVLPLLVVLAACAGGGGGDGGGGEPPQVVATVYPLAWLAGEIAPDAELTSLAGTGAEVHDLELRPQERAAIETADVVVFLGDLGFQPQVEDAVAAAQARTVDVADVLGPASLRTLEGHEGEAGAVDPHVWLDPTLLADVAPALGAALGSVDPDRAAVYENRAAALAQRLRALDAELDAVLSECALDTAIVSHEAYGYLLGPRGLEQLGVAGADPEAGASPAELARLVERIRDEGIPAVLAEPAEGRPEAEALAREAGVELLEIDPLEVAPSERAEVGFPQLLREQAEAFATALRCAGSP